MNFRPFLCALPLALAACGPSATAPEPPLAGARIGGPFALTDQDGKPRSDRDFAGRYRLMYFGYTFCPDVCPVDLQKLMAGYRLLEKSDPQIAVRIAPIFVSVDPERDTPPVLKQYVGAFHPKLTGLTGAPGQIAQVAKEYAIYYAKEKPPGASDYLVNHSRVAYLLGPKGEPIALIPQDGTPQQIAAELKRWVT
jgi:protein SCO1/2